MGQRGQTASGTLQRSRALRCSGLGGYEPTAFTEEVLGTPRCDFGTVVGDKQGCPGVICGLKQGSGIRFGFFLRRTHWE